MVDFAALTLIGAGHTMPWRECFNSGVTVLNQ